MISMKRIIFWDEMSTIVYNNKKVFLDYIYLMT